MPGLHRRSSLGGLWILGLASGEDCFRWGVLRGSHRWGDPDRFTLLEFWHSGFSDFWTFGHFVLELIDYRSRVNNLRHNALIYLIRIVIQQVMQSDFTKSGVPNDQVVRGVADSGNTRCVFGLWVIPGNNYTVQICRTSVFNPQFRPLRRTSCSGWKARQ